MASPDWLTQAIQLGALVPLGVGLLGLARKVGRMEQRLEDRDRECDVHKKQDDKRDEKSSAQAGELGDMREAVARIEVRCEERESRSGVHYVGPFDASGSHGGNGNGNGGCAR